MLTQSQYQNAVYIASRANAALVEKLRSKEALGFYPDWNLAACQGLKIKSGKWSLAIQDYISTASVDIYNQLLDIGSTWMGGITVDPNAQLPAVTIFTINVLQNWNSGKILFSTTNGSPQFVLSNYNGTYKPLYGNNPILALYITSGDYTGEYQTPPTIDYVVNNDPTSDILTITYDFPIATTGYLSISGSSGSTTGAGGGTIIIQPDPPTPSDQSFIFV